MANNELERLVDIRTAAEFLMVKENTIRLWCMERRIPFKKAGSRLRFKLSELDKWAEYAGSNNKVAKKK